MPCAATCSMARPNVTPPTRIDDQVGVAREGLDDVGGAETAEDLVRSSGVAHQCGDAGAALTGELDRAIRPTPPVAPVTRTRLPSTRPPTSSAFSAVNPAVGSVAAFVSVTRSGDRG